MPLSTEGPVGTPCVRTEAGEGRESIHKQDFWGMQPTAFLGKLPVVGCYGTVGEGSGRGSGGRLNLFVDAKFYDCIFIFSLIPSSRPWGFASSVWGLLKKE